MPKQINYPEKLYRFRDGIVTYRHIEGNIYENTSCRDRQLPTTKVAGLQKPS